MKENFFFLFHTCKFLPIFSFFCWNDFAPLDKSVVFITRPFPESDWKDSSRSIGQSEFQYKTVFNFLKVSNEKIRSVAAEKTVSGGVWVINMLSIALEFSLFLLSNINWNRENWFVDALGRILILIWYTYYPLCWGCLLL